MSLLRMEDKRFYSSMELADHGQELRLEVSSPTGDWPVDRFEASMYLTKAQALELARALTAWAETQE